MKVSRQGDLHLEMPWYTRTIKAALKSTVYGIISLAPKGRNKSHSAGTRTRFGESFDRHKRINFTNVTPVRPFLATHLEFAGVFDCVNVSPARTYVSRAACSRRLTVNVTAGQRGIIYENTPGAFPRQFSRALWRTADVKGRTREKSRGLRS